MANKVGMETSTWYRNTYSLAVMPANCAVSASSAEMAMLSDPNGVGMTVALVATTAAALSVLMPA